MSKEHDGGGEQSQGTDVATHMPDGHNNGEGWNKHILLELKRLAAGQKEILKSQTDIKVELPQKADAIELEKFKGTVKAQFSALKVKAGFWGAFGASIPTSLLILYEILNRVQGAGP